MVSNTIIGRAFPIWIKLYTVGPQTYIFTFPGSRGTNSYFLPLRVLKIFIKLLLNWSSGSFALAASRAGLAPAYFHSVIITVIGGRCQ